MHSYRYKAVINNQIVSGHITAQSDLEAAKVIRMISSHIIYISKQIICLKKVNRQLIANWFRNLGILMNQGVKIEDALTLVSTEKQYKFSVGILELIKAGFSFSEAIEHHGFFFDKQSQRIIKVISKFMNIQKMCELLQTYHDRVNSKFSRIKKVVIGPIITLCISITLCTIIVVLMKDTVKELTSDLNAEMPPIFCLIEQTKYWHLVLLALFAIFIAIGLKKYIAQLPWFKSYYRNQDIFIALHCIGNSLNNGVSILESVEMATGPLTTNYMKSILAQLRASLLSGVSVHKSLSIAGLSQNYVAIMKIHESSGELPMGFLNASNLAEDRLDRQFHLLTNLIGPSIIVLNALCILIFINVTILPIYSCINVNIL